MFIFFSSFLINLVSFALYSSLCAIYYWVTVRNSQSYWHLEHMGETLACTQGGAGSVGGARGLQGSWMGGGRGNAASLGTHVLQGEVGHFL